LRKPGESGIVGEFAHQTRTLAVFGLLDWLNVTRYHLTTKASYNPAPEWRNWQTRRTQKRVL
jgi:hypothetical protein